MMWRILSILILLCASAGSAQAQEQPEVFAQPGQTEGVLSIAFSPDGKLLVSSGEDHSIKIWDMATGRVLRSVSGHALAVESVALSPDGKLLASGSDDHMVKLWDAASGRELLSLIEHTGAVSSVAFSPDGKLLASGSDDRAIKLWDVASGRELRTLSGHSDGVDSVAFSPDGKLLASGSRDKTIKLWDVASGGALFTLSGHSGPVASVAFSPDGHLVASASWDHTVKLWDAASGRELRTLSGHADGVSSVAFSPDAKILASGGLDGAIKLWDAASGRELRTLKGSSSAVLSVAFSPDGRVVASGGVDGSVRIWDVAVNGGALSFGAKPAPKVEFVDLPASTTEPELAVTLRITDAGGGVGEVRLFLNGGSILQDTVAPIAPSPGSAPITRNYTVRLASGLNRLRAVAFNADDSMQSDSATVIVTANVPPASKGVLHALVVGIQEFPKRPENNLRYAVADAQLIADTLRKYSAPLFETVDIKLLTTAAETDKDHVVQALTAMQATTGPDDEFVFYVASHGVVVDGEYYLVTSNVSALDAMKSEAIGEKQLAGLLANIPAPRKLIILDTSHAQPVGDALQQAELNGGMSDAVATTILSREIGSTVLAAATTDQEALEGYKNHGLFAYVLADGLAGKAASSDRIVTNIDLAAYVAAIVPRLAMNLSQHDQNPTVQTWGPPFPITGVK